MTRHPEVGRQPALGLAVGFATVHFIASLLYEVKSTDPRMTITPILIIAN